MWFYTWQDCDFIYATRNPTTYCSQSNIDCSTYDGNLQDRLAEMSKAYADFRGSNQVRAC